MIIGIGTDMVSLARLKKQLAQFSQPILDRLFTPAEQARAGQKNVKRHSSGFTLNGLRRKKLLPKRSEPVSVGLFPGRKWKW